MFSGADSSPKTAMSPRFTSPISGLSSMIQPIARRNVGMRTTIESMTTNPVRNGRSVRLKRKVSGTRKTNVTSRLSIAKTAVFASVSRKKGLRKSAT